MDVFAYGPLTEPAVVGRVLDSFVFVGAATLTGLRPVEGERPTLVPGGETAGRILRTDDLAPLDASERVGTGRAVRMAAPFVAPDGYPATVSLYVRDPDRVGADATWPGAASFATRVKTYQTGCDVRVWFRDRSPSAVE